MRDIAGTQRVAIVNDTLAARLWPGQSPIGHLVLIQNKNYMVVGEVRNVLMHNALDSPETAVYVPFWQNDLQPEVDARMCIRVRNDARAMLPMIRQAVTDADANVPVTELSSLAEQIATRYFQVFLAADAIQFAGALALLLSALGLYAVLSFVVAGRTREIGIRLALGAQTSDVMRMVLGQGARLALYGVAVGGAGAIGLTGLLAAWLYGVPARDPAIFLAAAAALLAVALAACYVPARRAMNVDPMIALRNE
jgi:predicted lysophospholipase L1 biosynthesis ABC-type transport system permease subunit